MIHVTLPEERQHRLPFYLAMEEYLAEHCGEDLLFLWQVEPTVIFGRNQVLQAEVNVAYCEAHHIQYYRRKSGGGCVYADKGNVMVSYITPKTTADAAFAEFLNKMAEALRALGLPAVRTEHNDILIDGRKVSGNAFTLLPKGSIVHGTMMYDVDYEALVAAITPSRGKIGSKGVSSVRSHVTNLKEELEAIGKPVGLEAFKRHLINFFCADAAGNLDEAVLSDADMTEIDRIERTYLDPAFLEGKHHSYSVSFGGRVEGAGEVRVVIGLESEIIGSVRLEGDFFQTRENVAEELEAAVKGLPLEKDAVGPKLKNLNLNIIGLAGEDLLRIMFPEEQNK